MATTFTLELKDQPTSAGLYPVYIRITKDRKHKRIKTSIALKKKSDWNPKKKEIRSSEKHCQAWNEQLEKELEEARQVYREKKDASLDQLVKSIKEKEVSDSFLSFAVARVEKAGAKQSIGTYRHYKTTLAFLKSYLKERGRGDILFNEVNLAFLKDFEAYLASVENGRAKGRKLDVITRQNYLKKLRKLVNGAVEEGQLSSSPFGKGAGKFKIEGESNSTKEKLELEELNSITSLDLPEGGAMWHTRNAFLFSFYCAGIRAGDLLQLRWHNIQDGRLIYKMDKNKKPRNFELVEEAKRILDLYRVEDSKETDYIFPFLDSRAKWAIESVEGKENMGDDLQKALFNNIASRNVILNRNLKLIAEKAGIKKKVTFHTSRHTFASLAMKEGVESAKIQGLLAHSSLTITEKYMGQFGKKAEDEALKKVADAVARRKPEETPKTALISALKELDKETLAEVLKDLNISQ
ncbi:MAG: site-specific integrase [Bacteroidales bacterium]|nr:site-specific integrase [Bacteroidales bacterium]